MTAPAAPRLDPRDALPWDGASDAMVAVLERLGRWRNEARTIALATPAEVGSELDPALPLEGAPLAALIAEFERVAVAHARNHAHPGFFGYVSGPGLGTDPVAAALAAALNQNVTGFPSSPGPTVIERTVVGWLARIAGLPQETEGLFTSGGSLGNFTAIATALATALGDRFAQEGLAAAAAARGAPRIYRAPTAHFSIDRAGVLAGLGRAGVVTVDVDVEDRLDPVALDAAIAADRARGALPVLVVATAGATTSGVIDPVDTIADVCERHGVWLHVDAAYGGGALLAPELRPRLAGIERADSLVMDLHKAFYLALDASVVLVRRPGALSGAFYATADYAHLPKRGDAGDFAFYHLGPETSRRFRALPAWLAFRHYGLRRLGANVAHNAACAGYLERLCRDSPDLEVVAPASLGIVCFRYAPPGADPARLDALNEAIRERLLAGGSFYLSSARVRGRAALRVCICNHATDAGVIDRLVGAVLEAGRELGRDA